VPSQAYCDPDSSTNADIKHRELFTPYVEKNTGIRWLQELIHWYVVAALALSAP
jgi:hypothetical protein